MARSSRLVSRRLSRGPRKGQVVIGYMGKGGKFTEARRGRGATKQRRAVARAAGVKDRFGRTAQMRSKKRAASKRMRVSARKAKGLTRSGRRKKR